MNPTPHVRMMRLLGLPVVGLAAAALASNPVYALDPSAPGTFSTTTETYDLGATAFQPTALPSPVELQAVVHAPEQLQAGPFPLVLVLHGRHVTCYTPDGTTFMEWPCSPGRQPIPSYRGYDYWAENLASHGYVVVSIGANGVNATDNATADFGATARAELLARHIELWSNWNAGGPGPFNGKYTGSVDIDRIGLIGHSRGGEGVARIVELNQQMGSPLAIRGAMLMAPIDYGRRPVTRVPLASLVPYCDGDVIELQGVHYFDDSIYADAGDETPKYLFMLDGANHNYFSTAWSPSTFSAGAYDDFLLVEQIAGQDPHCSEALSTARLTETEQQSIWVDYGNAFVRAHVGGETEFEPLLRGEASSSGQSFDYRLLTSHMPAASQRRVINKIDRAESLGINDMEELVEWDGLLTYDICGLAFSPTGYDHCVLNPGYLDGNLYEGREPHVPGQGHLLLGFTPGAFWANWLPVGTSASEFAYLQFRAGIDTEDSSFAGSSVDFTILLHDEFGASAETKVSTWSDTLRRPGGALFPVTPKLMLNAVRIPLEAFSGVDLDNLAAVEFFFDEPGAILLADLAFVGAATQPEEGEEEEEEESAGDETDGGAGESGDPDADDGTSGDETGSGEPALDTESESGCGCRATDEGPNQVLGVLFMMFAMFGGGRRSRSSHQIRNRLGKKE